MPVDPPSGGTWIAVNDAALVCVLLNANPPGGRTGAGTVSRGLVVPAVAGATTLGDAFERARAIDVSRMAPFRLLLVQQTQLVECWTHEGRLAWRRAVLQGPLMRTSSGLGDDVVAAPRRLLFRRFFRAPADAVAAQDAFHAHAWPGHEHLSVQMRRPGARTVSRTVVELRDGLATMTCRAIDGPDATTVHVPVAGPGDHAGAYQRLG
jgi:hypothetical protein